VVPDFAFATLGEGDAAAGDAAGEGLAAGLAMFAGVLVAGTAGEAEVVGVEVAGAFELF
jgi:hypothetical protein